VVGGTTRLGHPCSSCPKVGTGGPRCSLPTPPLYIPQQRRVLLLAAAAGAEPGLAKTLGLADYRFVHPQYLDGDSSLHAQALLLNVLGVRQLDATQAVRAVLQLHADPVTLLANHSDAEIAGHAHFVWQHCDSLAKGGDQSQQLLLAELQAAAQRTLHLMIRPAAASANASGRSAGFRPAVSHVYIAAAGKGWRLEDVLLPGEVAYLRKEPYRAAAASSADAAEAFERWLVKGLGVLEFARLCDGAGGSGPQLSPEFARAVAAGRWRPILGMLRDLWAEAYDKQAQAGSAPFCKELAAMEVAVKLPAAEGHLPRVETEKVARLDSSFLESGGLAAAFRGALPWLHLGPALSQPPDGAAAWAFLQLLGVRGAGLGRPAAGDVVAALQLLSARDAQPEAREAALMYSLLASALEPAGSGAAGGAAGSEAVKTAFRTHPLLFFPGLPARDAAHGKPRGQWHVLGPDAVWTAPWKWLNLLQGCRLVISQPTEYARSAPMRTLFTDPLGVKEEAGPEDLGDAMRFLAALGPQQPGPAGSDRELVNTLRSKSTSVFASLVEACLIPKSGRQQAAAPNWLMQLMRDRVLLTRDPKSRSSYFSACSKTHLVRIGT
jgi:hypothetical protein